MWIRILAVFTACTLLGAGSLGAQPLVDSGFAPATPSPDPDLVVVREAAFGAGGVDLTAYGLGTPDYVQSIYLRFFVDNVVSTVDSFTGRVVFPPGVTILGVIDGEASLGGSADDGTATGTDAIFGVAVDPDDYSEQARGFECCGGVATSEFVCQVDDRTLVYGLNINSGVDDFRIIIDYGDSFPADLSFDIGAYALSSLGGAVPSEGIRVGLPGSGVIGSGDFGETPGLQGIPLTAGSDPVPVGSIPFDPESNLFMLRDVGSSSFVDGFDVDKRIPAPDRYRITTIDTPAGITEGPDGMIYAVGADGGYAVMVPESDSVRAVLVQNLPGTTVDLTNVPGTRTLFHARDTSEDTYVDHFDVDTESFTAVDTIAAGVLSTPVGIADGGDGRLYVLGSGDGLVAVDPLTREITDLKLDVNPAGSYVGLTCIDGEGELYFLRDAGSTTSIDLYFPDSDSLVLDFASFSELTTPKSITDGPAGRLFVMGSNSSSDDVVVEVDVLTGFVIQNDECLRFTGAYRAITALGTSTVGTPGRRSADRGMPHRAAPNPFRGATRIGFVLERSGPVTVDLFTLSGRRVSRLFEGSLGEGPHEIPWNVGDGATVPSGIYYYRIVAGDRVATGRVVRLR